MSSFIAGPSARILTWPSATVAGDKFRPIQNLLLRTLACRGALFHQSSNRFRYALNLQHKLTLGVLTHLTPLHSPHCNIVDLLAFSIIFFAAKRSGPDGYQGIPSILDIILRDATLYFISVFICQSVLEFFLLLAPVGDI